MIVLNKNEGYRGYALLFVIAKSVDNSYFNRFIDFKVVNILDIAAMADTRCNFVFDTFDSFLKQKIETMDSNQLKIYFKPYSSLSNLPLASNLLFSIADLYGGLIGF